ncbi:hypothetical protein D3C80_1882850 [compost metagenome]
MDLGASASTVAPALGLASGSGSMKPLARPWAKACGLMAFSEQEGPTGHSPFLKWKAFAPWR